MIKHLKKYEPIVGIYVSDRGEVFRRVDGAYCLLKSRPDKQGYRIVSIRDKDGKSHTLKIHRMVAQCFIPNPENLPYVNHKDGLKFNNNVNNLEWCTPQYNRIDALKNGLAKMYTVRVTNKLTGEVQEYKGYKEVAEVFNCNIAMVKYAIDHECVKGKFKNYKLECFVRGEE